MTTGNAVDLRDKVKDYIDNDITFNASPAVSQAILRVMIYAVDAAYIDHNAISAIDDKVAEEGTLYSDSYYLWGMHTSY